MSTRFKEEALSPVFVVSGVDRAERECDLTRSAIDSIIRQFTRPPPANARTAGTDTPAVALWVGYGICPILTLRNGIGRCGHLPRTESLRKTEIATLRSQ